jgi:N-acetylated-alpha-linked acidic dipeptidase
MNNQQKCTGGRWRISTPKRIRHWLLLLGLAAMSPAADPSWEQKFRGVPDPQNLRAYMQRLSARPHHVGSPYDKDNAEWIAAKLKSWGLDPRIENFDVLFPTPKDRVVEMVAPGKFAARLEEPAVPGDPTSGQKD